MFFFVITLFLQFSSFLIYFQFQFFKFKLFYNQSFCAVFCFLIVQRINMQIMFFQLFSVLFFLMLFVLGIGSAIAIVGGIISIIGDQFPSWKNWHIVLATSLIGFLVGTIYCTPVSFSSITQKLLIYV